MKNLRVCARAALSPLWGLLVSHSDPWLTPWAAFFRRCAAMMARTSNCVGFEFPRRLPRQFTVLLCGALSVAVSAQKPRPAASFAKPNVVLITIDTVRADHLGCYGYSKIHTPTLDAFAREGVVFEHASSQVPLTWPSHTAILTGTYPFQNGVQDFTGQPLDPKFRSVAQAFKDNGYVTGAVVSAFVLDRSWGLARGFDFYDDAFSPEAFQNKDPGLVDRRADASVARAIEWLRKTKQKTSRPFFLWLHLYDPHSPYDPPEPYRTDYREHPYDGEIAYADHELGRLTAWLRQNQMYSRTAIVAASDHGESLGEHEEQEHGFFLYNSTVHVPIIVKPTGGAGVKNKLVSEPVETIAIAPTLLRLAGIKDRIEEQFSAPGLLDTRNESRAVYGETFYPFSSFGWNPLHSLQVGHYRYIDAPKPELYDESADPAEQTNIVARQPATVTVMKEKLKTLLQSKPYAASSSSDTPALAPDAQEKLQALGYVAYRSPVSAEALAAGLADPKDKIGQFNRILHAQDDFRTGNFEEAQKLLAEVQREEPKMYILPFMAAEAAARRRDWDTSSREFKKCLDLNPTFDQAMTGLARALFNSGNAAEAKQWAERALKINPSNWRAWYALASIESKGDDQAAMNDFEKAVAIQANFALLQRDFGLLLYREQRYKEAAERLARAGELGLREARLYNVLGISYAHSGSVAKAVAAYKQALAIDPELADAHLNLGYVYGQMGKPTDSKAEYEAACRLDSKFCKYVQQGPR